jgi:hypothetical protein
VTGNSSKRKEREILCSDREREENKDEKGKDRNTTVALAILW